MRIILSTLLLVSIAILIGTTIKNDPGHVAITMAGKTIETSFAFFSFSALVVFALLALAIKLALYLYHIPEKLGEYRKHQKQTHARNDLTQGLIDLAEGKWSSAEKKLAKLADYSDAQLINYLAAARAAQHQNAHDRRDDYLKKAIEKNPEANIAVGITQAELQISHNQIEQALATLNWLLKLSPRHIYVKKLLAKIYLKLQDWQKLISLMPELRKHHLFNSDVIDEMEINAYAKHLENLAITPDELNRVWKQIPKKLKSNQGILYQYCNQLLNLNDVKSLEECIKSQPEGQWDDRIIKLLGLVKIEDTSKVLEFAEGLLPEHDKSAMLFLTLGRLCMQRKLWGKAKTYFEQSLAIKALPETYQELAILHQQLDEIDEANAMFRKGLALLNS